MASIGRLGILSDVHNDLDGLQRALELLSDCDKVVHLGDLVEDAAEANAVVDMLRKHRVEGVSGYHDELALQISHQFSEPTRRYLAALPKELPRGDFHLVHDNPLSKQKNEGLTSSGGYIRDLHAAHRVFEESAIRVLLVGHTHRAEQYVFDGEQVELFAGEALALDGRRRYILNPGAVCNQLRGTPPSVGVYDFASATFSIRQL